MMTVSRLVRTTEFLTGLLAAAFCLALCGCSDNQEPPREVDVGIDVQISKRPKDETWLEIFEDGKKSFETKLSDSEICHASVSDVSPVKDGQFDFDHDGVPEIVVDMWDGGNRMDTVFVLGKRDGEWSVRNNIATPFDRDFRDVDGDGFMELVIPPKNGNPGEVLPFRQGRFVDE